LCETNFAGLAMTRILYICLPFFTVTLMSGCASMDNTGQGAVFGGLLGAGTGAVIGHAVGNTGAGAAIGAGVGALTGATVGAGEDERDARNRAAAAQMQAQAAAGAVGVPDVVAMTQAHLEEGLIIERIRSRGITAPLQTNDVIYLHQQGVSPNVIEAMQSTPVATAMLVPPGPYYYPPPPDGAVYVGGDYYYGHPHYYYPPPRVGIGIGFR
jgi:hypothetical protein